MSKSTDLPGCSCFPFLPGLLGIAFVVLKLCGTIDWNWAWVTAPFWVPVALAFVALSLFVAVGGVVLLAGVIVAAVSD